MAIKQLQGYTDIDTLVFKFDAGDVTTAQQTVIDLPDNVMIIDGILLSSAVTGNVITVDAVDAAGTTVATVVTGDGTVAAINTKTVDQYVELTVPTKLVISGSVAGTAGVSSTLVVNFIPVDKQEYSTR